jgi:hypothetical protein
LVKNASTSLVFRGCDSTGLKLTIFANKTHPSRAARIQESGFSPNPDFSPNPKLVTLPGGERVLRKALKAAQDAPNNGASLKRFKIEAAADKDGLLTNPGGLTRVSGSTRIQHPVDV